MKLNLLLCVIISSFAFAEPQKMLMPDYPAVSPDGSQIAFAWGDDIWLTETDSGISRPITTHPAYDYRPNFSPDGKSLALTSNRSGTYQVYTMPATGGELKQVTTNSEGSYLLQWPDSQDELLILARRDHFWKYPYRLFTISKDGKEDEHLLFDELTRFGRLSHDGQKVLFVKEGARRYRKNYTGSQCGQIWLYDRIADKYEKLVVNDNQNLFPIWGENDECFYYASEASGCFNLWKYDFKRGKPKQVTFFEDDGVYNPAISQDGQTIVFRRLFDLYVFYPNKDIAPAKIDLKKSAESITTSVINKKSTTASELAYTEDGLELAFIAEGDVYVMDTVLCEPVAVTDTPQWESDISFSPDGKFIMFTRIDESGQTDIWEVSRKDEDLYWWQNKEFVFTRVTNSALTPSQISYSPDGESIAYYTKTEAFWTENIKTGQKHKLIDSWDSPSYVWSPDSKWIAFAIANDEYDSDIWIVPADGSKEAVNISRYYGYENYLAWSPDGSKLAFVRYHIDDEPDVCYVNLTEASEDETARDRKLKEAIEKMEKNAKKTPSKKDDDSEDDLQKDEQKQETKTEDNKADEDTEDEGLVKIDFDNIYERVHRVSLKGIRESNLFWSSDSKKLIFRGTGSPTQSYCITFPDELTPKKFSANTGSHAKWIEKGNRILWISNGKVATCSKDGKNENLDYTIYKEINLKDKYAAGFSEAWEYMQDIFYDENMNNLDWNEIREKYEICAKNASDGRALSETVNLMLGELNASHLGYTTAEPTWKTPNQWVEQTMHLGVTFDLNRTGNGLKVISVLPDGPADKTNSRIEPGETIAAIDGVVITPESNVTKILTGQADRIFELEILDRCGVARTIELTPITYTRAQELIMEKWISDNRKKVEDASGGKFGYLYIKAMNEENLERFRKEVYEQTFGAEGLIVDVRDNGGGYITDHLLTILCQPEHAVTIPRGGGQGYPQSRRIYYTKNIPIVVLCNQGSFSNAEIFTHAIKTLKRGKVVGVPTAGGVVSTGSKKIMDLGTIRTPFRGWFTLEGEDYECNGAVPDFIVWPKPGEFAEGIDKQLDKAIDVLSDEMKKARGPITPIYKSQRK